MDRPLEVDKSTPKCLGIYTVDGRFLPSRSMFGR